MAGAKSYVNLTLVSLIVLSWFGESMATQYTARTVQVYTKSSWGDDWTERPELEAIRATLSAAPEMSQARVRQFFGSTLRSPATSFSAESPLNLANHYVKIEDTDSETTWVGVFPENVYDLYAADAQDPTGVQGWPAYGLEYLLTKIPMNYAAVRPADGVLIDVNYVPTYNLRNQAGGTLLGNRDTTDAYAFSADGEVWTYQNILEAIRDYYLDETWLGGPEWELSGLYADLDTLSDVIDLDGATVFQALNTLIERKRGYAWCLRTNGGKTDSVRIHVFSLFADDITISGDTFHANTEQSVIDLSGRDDINSTIINLSRSAQYDYINVRGARVKSCFSVSVTDGTLEGAWATSDEQAYRDGASGAAGYAGWTHAEQEEANDLVRASSALQRVFQLFRVPPEWNGFVKDSTGGSTNYVAIPKIDTDGTILPLWLGAAYNVNRPVLAWLPLREAADYTTGPPYTLTLPTNGEARFMQPFILIKDDQGKYRFAHNVGDTGAPSAQVSAATREMAINCRFNPAHAFARGVWEDSAHEPSSCVSMCDYREAIATIAIETDEVLRVYATNSDAPTGDVRSELTIDIPSAELWYVAPKTVVGVDNNGALQRIADSTDPITLRDDSAQLRRVAQLALAWYGIPRASVKYTAARLVADHAVGEFITTARRSAGLVTTVNAPVTRVTWNYRTPRSSSFETSWWNADWRKIASVNLPGVPDLASLKRYTKHIAGAVSGLTTVEEG